MHCSAMTQFTLHTSALFDPKLNRVRSNVSITVDSKTGLIVRVYQRQNTEPFPEPLPEGDIDLRGKYVMPGLVDAHTHLFLHSYE